MKRFILLYSVLICFVIIYMQAYAHSGSLDSNGGHWNHTTGEYHYHTGEHKYGNSSSSSYKKDNFVPPYEPPEKETESNSTDILSSLISFVIILLILTIITACVMIIPISLPGTSLKKYQELVENIETSVYKVKRIMILRKKDISQIIPKQYEIDNLGLPRDIEYETYWGKTFTLYKTDRGNKYHTKYGCSSAFIPINCCRLPSYMKNIKNIQRFFCRKCAYNYKLPDLSWYEDYKLYLTSEKDYKELKLKVISLREELIVQYRFCNFTLARFFILFSKSNRQLLRQLNARSKPYLKKYSRT